MCSMLFDVGSLCKPCEIPQPVFDCAFWLGYCNSLLNPIIYATWNREFRKTFVWLLRNRFRKKKPFAVSYLAQLSAQQIGQTATDYRTITVRTTSLADSKWNSSSKRMYSMESSILLNETAVEESICSLPVERL